MISMVIADDELIIRQGLLTIPWKEYGIEVKGVAVNGEEALTLVRSTCPQILLTDIRMPGMDGLALIEAVKREIPEIKAILLTGYQDFGYAHTAIRLGATGYILKPSDPDEIIAVVLKAKEQIEDEMRKKYERQQYKQQFDTAKTAIWSSFLQDLIYGRITDMEAITDKCREFNHPLENYVVMVLELEARSTVTPNERIIKMKEEIYNTASSYNKCIILDLNQSTCCIINERSTDEEDVKDKMLSLAMEIRNNLKSKLDTYVSIGISRNSRNAADIGTVFNQAVNCLKMKFSLGKGAVIHVEDLKDSLKREYSQTLKLSDEVLESIKRGNYAKAEKLSRELLYRLAKEQKADEKIIKSICFDILVSSFRILKEEKSIETAELDENLILSMLTECADIEELEEYVIQALLNILDSICSKAPAARNKVISDILNYIEKFYMEDISLLTVSEFVHMNHIYVSRLIKKETGETFLDILTRIRMKKACELLISSDCKTYEISCKIGLKDPGYFSQVFKKYHGVTPSEYREGFYARQKELREA